MSELIVIFTEEILNVTITPDGLDVVIEEGILDVNLGTVVEITNDYTSLDLNYVHTQAVPSTTWTINHNLGKFASLVVVDTSDREWHGDVVHNSINQMVVTFSASFGGKAYCN